MTNFIKKYWYIFLKQQDYLLGVWSCKGMQWRGYSKRPMHPKHLFDAQRSDYLHELFRPNTTFLDMGSGVGTDCLLATKKGVAISIGVEGNWQSIVTAAGRIPDIGGAMSFLQVDLEQGSLPFADNCFDLVNFSNVLEHLNNRPAILQELKRVKKKEGLAVISIPNAGTSWKKKLAAAGLDPMDDPDHKIEYSRETLRDELSTADLMISSDLMPIIPSFPWNGLIAMSAVVSPSLYRRLQAAKRKYVLAHPEESIGWVFTVQ
jgi:SAM-dependent methyltransferase